MPADQQWHFSHVAEMFTSSSMTFGGKQYRPGHQEMKQRYDEYDSHLVYPVLKSEYEARVNRLVFIW